MAPTADQDFSIATTDTMNTTTNNALSAYIANTSVANPESFFGAYQNTAVGSSEFSIRTIVPPSISSEPYRKVMIAIFFFRRILSFSSSPSVSFSDLTATVAAYFGIPTSAAEREAERIVDSVHQAFFHVGNLQGIGFLNSSGKGMKITDLTNRAADILFFTFRFTVTANMIDPRFASTTLSLDFSLRLPQSYIPIALAPATNLTSVLNTPPRTPIQSSASGPSVTSALTNATEDILKAMDET